MTPLSPRRRTMLGLLAASAGAAALPGAALAQDETASEYLMGDIIIGDPEAPVTVYEYVSLTCPHCATFHTRSWPAIKRDYVDTGKAHFIMREVYFDRLGLWATMAARCGNEASYHAMIDQFLTRQEVWTRDEQPAEAIRKVARLNGVPEDRLDACLGDRGYAEALVEAYQSQVAEHGVESTPTFIINGERVSGALSAEDLGAIIDGHL